MAADMTPHENNKKSTIQLIEESFQLLKTIPVGTFVYYYLGTMPFLLALFYFLNDMSRNVFADEYCVAASFGLATLFIWMKTWQAIFSIQLFRHLSQIDLVPRSFLCIGRMILVQTIIQSSAIIVLPVALIITIPFAWTIAAYQLALIHDVSEGTGIQILIKNNFQTAQHFTAVNHLMLLFVFIFSLFVLANIGAAVYGLPFLTKMLFGVDSVFTLGGFNPLNTTFLFSIAGMTYLCIDPLFKSFFVLQKFYYQSRKTGEDLMADLDRIGSMTKKTVIVLLCLMVFPAPDKSFADQLVTDSHTAVSHIEAKKLETAIHDVLSHREYAWRMPKQSNKEIIRKDKGFFYKIVEWTITQCKNAVAAFKSWVNNFMEWLEKLFQKEPKKNKPPNPKTKINPNILAVTLIGIVTIFLAFIFYTLGKQNKKSTPDPIKTDEERPDINDENLLADQLTSEKWIDIALELTEKKEFRLAIRALYLATLAFLAANHFIIIARHKSNSDYQMELSRRLHSKPQIISDFVHTIQTVDRVWYGMYEINKQGVEHFLDTQKRILHFEK